MKLVINVSFGGFSVNDSIAKECGFDKYYVPRDNEKLIELLEQGVDCNGSSAELKVVDIPEEATDYCIVKHDGAEDVVYVVDGKIEWLR